MPEILRTAQEIRQDAIESRDKEWSDAIHGVSPGWVKEQFSTPEDYGPFLHEQLKLYREHETYRAEVLREEAAKVAEELFATGTYQSVQDRIASGIRKLKVKE